MPIEPVALSLSSVAIGWFVSMATKFGGNFADELSSKAEKALMEWITGKFKETDNEASLKKAAEKPSSSGRKLRAQGILEEIIEENPQLEDDLRNLLSQIPEKKIKDVQEQIINGDNNVVANVKGSNNRLNIKSEKF